MNSSRKIRDGVQYFTILILLFLKTVSADDERTSTQRLYGNLFNDSHKKDILPVVNRSQPVLVEFGFDLINIVDVNAKKQALSVYGWVRQKWNNSLLMWDPDQYGGVDTIHISPNKVWVPDILLYSNVDDQDHTGGGRTTYKTDVILHSNGTNVWNSPALLKSICQIQVRYFPFDNQNCSLKFGSWTHDTRTIDLHPMDILFPTGYYTKNGEWSVYDVVLQGNRKRYECCPRMLFADISLTIKMRRESMDYFINLIIPCCLISSMIFLGFVLPPESGERIGLSITVLLAMTVFQQLTSEIMPAYDFPLLGQYYFAIVLEISASIVVTTMILNFYHRTNRKMPFWLHKLVLNWISRIVLLHDVVVKTNPRRRCSTKGNPSLRSTKYNQRAQSSKSFHGLRASTRNQNSECNAEGSAFELSYGDNIFSNDRTSDHQDMELHKRQNNYPFITNPNSKDSGEGDREGGSWEDDGDISEEEQVYRHWEWTLAAKILDRFILCIAVILGIITVAAIFLRAPALWDRQPELKKDNPKPITNHTMN